MITRTLKVSEVLKTYPQTLEVFVGASVHFRKLRNPLLRKALAARVTIEQAARIGGVEAEDLLRRLNEAAGLEYRQGEIPGEPEGDTADAEIEAINEAIIGTVARDEVVLDVRPVLAGGSDPLKVILQAVRELNNGQALHLVNSFEPMPLYSVLGDKGFDHFTRKVDETWHIWFFRKETADTGEGNQKPSEKENGRSGSVRTEAENIVELDVRGLPPPEPMMQILRKLAEVDEKTILLVHHHREPMMLYEKLEARGYKAVTEQIEEHYYKVVIRKG